MEQNELHTEAKELMQDLGIDEEWIKGFLDYFSLKPEEIQVLMSLSETSTPDKTAYLWDAFYAHLKRFARTDRFLADATSLAALKQVQSVHFFELLKGDYGLDFILSRFKVGLKHDDIGLDFLTYGGAYGKYLELVMGHALKNTQASDVPVLKALSKIVLLSILLESYSFIAVREKRYGLQKEHLVRVNRAFNVIHLINQLIVRSTDLDRLLSDAVKILVEDGGFALAWVGMLNPQNGLIQPKAAYGLTDYLDGITVSVDPAVLEGRGPIGTAYREKRVVVIQATDSDTGFAPWKERAQAFGLRSVIVIPIIIKDEVRGTLNLYSNRYDFFVDDELVVWEEVVADIAYAIEVLEQRAEVNRLLFWDSLTGLGNYKYFATRLEVVLGAMRLQDMRCLVVVLDLDGFGAINHALGLSKGDLILKTIADRLKNFLGDNGEVARLGADEFGIFLTIQDKNPLTIVERLRDSVFLPPIKLNSDELVISASIGISLAPEDALSADALINMAKMSLMDIKKSGGNRIGFYSKDLFEKNLQRVEQQRALKKALQNREFVLFFQPKVNLVERKIVGFEALIRWQHPQHGLIPPGKFIPVLEESGLIVDVGRWVIEETIRHIQANPVCSDLDFFISFNVSIKQMEQAGFIDELIHMVRISGVNPKRLKVEVTESLFMKNTREFIEKLNRIKEAGMAISIDDFGTGYSSLQYLKDIPASTIKIDYSFIKGLPDVREDIEIVKTILLLSKGLGKNVVAEGVETREQLVFLTGMGVDEAQGFYFAKPMPKGECLKWVEAYRSEDYFWPQRTK